MHKVYTNDVIEWSKQYDGPMFHALSSDPPYSLGFMGRYWDDDIAFRPETWAAFKKHMLPGAFGFAFASSRGWHRLAVAIEDAGFVIHPTMFLWAFGCLSEDSEILTSEGWKHHWELSEDEVVACYDIKGDEISYGPIENIFRYDYDDTAYRIRSDSTDQVVSRNHRCIVEREGRFVFAKAETLKHEETVPILENMPKRSTVHGANSRAGDLPKEMRRSELLRGKKDSRMSETGRRAIYQMPYLRGGGVQIRSLAQEGHRHSNLLSEMQCHPEDAEHGIPKAFESHRTERPGWLDGRIKEKLHREHGWRQKSGLEGRCDETPYSWQLQGSYLCNLPIGVRANVSEEWLCHGASFDSGTTDRQVVVQDGSCASYRPQSKKQRSIQFDAIQEQRGPQEVREIRNTGTTLATIEEFRYRGIMWCVKSPTGAFVARRNGKIFVTGNSGMPKGVRIDDERFDGYRYGLGALKPAVEPIICFQNPYDGKSIDSMLKYGAGAINIDNGRVGIVGGELHSASATARNGIYGATASQEVDKSPRGRWPSNLILQHLPGCKIVGEKSVKANVFNGGGPRQNSIYGSDNRPVREAAGYGDSEGLETVQEWQCATDCAVAELDQQSGISISTGGGGIKTTGDGVYQGHGFKPMDRGEMVGFGDEGGASRYFFNADFSQECVEGCPVKDLDSQSGITISTGGGGLKDRGCGSGRVYGDYGPQEYPKDVGLGDEGTVSRYFLNTDWSNEIQENLDNASPVKYVAKASGKERNAGLGDRNSHVCVKPLKLTEYLAKLLLPPIAYAPRRILVPFSGSGSEMIGAMLAGWEEIVGVEREPVHVEETERRMKFWAKPRAVEVLKTMTKKTATKVEKESEFEERSLFD